MILVTSFLFDEQDFSWLVNNRLSCLLQQIANNQPVFKDL